MAYEEFVAKRFKPRALQLIRECLSIVDEYVGQGLRLTLRQLYYQLVSRNIIRNTERDYHCLSPLVSDARLAGIMDWDAIEDRVRRPRSPNEFRDIDDLVKVALANYRLPRWATQETYAELWVEKDALAGVLEPLAAEAHVTMMVNRGYSSQSAMYEASKRFAQANLAGKTCVLYYLGDHDPSGEDMVRDIQDRMTMFGAGVLVRKLALTMGQVRQYNPPPNPAKITDPRAAEYISKHGASSWEVDALPPNVLTAIIRRAFDGLIDRPAMDAVIRLEERDKRRLKAALKRAKRKPKPKRRIPKVKPKPIRRSRGPRWTRQ